MQLKDLNDRIEVVRLTLLGVWDTATATELVVKDGVSNITEAELSLKRSREALDKAEMLLVSDGAKALNDSIISANSTGEYAKRMQEIKKEVQCTQTDMRTYIHTYIHRYIHTYMYTYIER